MMKFYFTPGSCSTGIHILLEELDVLFEAYVVDLLAGDQYEPAYLAINPKATIPTLVLDDGSALTEFQAIAYWLGHNYPQAGLLPENLDARVRVLEVMNYVICTVHMQGFARIFTTDKFAPNETDYDWVKARGHEIVSRGFAILNDALAGLQYVADTFSIADAALFYVEFWADRIDIELPLHCLAHYRYMLARPAVQRVLMEEGYNPGLLARADAL
jgi:glutathione S-transferase